MKESKHTVDNAALFQKRLPCERPKQKVHPHRQDKDQNDKAVLVYLHISQDHGKRVSQKKTDDRADQGEEQRQPKCLCVLSRCDRRDIFQRERSSLIGQSIVEDHSKRNKDEHDRPQRVGSRQPFTLRCQLQPPPRLRTPVCS